jgi:hypothetical protein
MIRLSLFGIISTVCVGQAAFNDESGSFNALTHELSSKFKVIKSHSIDYPLTK